MKGFHNQEKNYFAIDKLKHLLLLLVTSFKKVGTSFKF